MLCSVDNMLILILIGQGIKNYKLKPALSSKYICCNNLKVLRKTIDYRFINFEFQNSGKLLSDKQMVVNIGLRQKQGSCRTVENHYMTIFKKKIILLQRNSGVAV